jgi:hypothetical protein
LVHLIVSPTLIVIGFGLNAKATIEAATVLEAWAVVVVGVAVVVGVGVAVVVGVGVAVVVGVGVAVVVGVGVAAVVVVDLTVVVDPVVVLAGIGGLVGWLVDDGWTVSRVDRSATVDESAELPVVVVAELDGDPHATTTSERTAPTANHLRSPVSPLIQDSLPAHGSQKPPWYLRAGPSVWTVQYNG